MSHSAPAVSLGVRGRAQSVDFNSRYGIFLCVILIGYATFGKGFAYIGVPPLFIGEIALALGILVILRSGCGIAVFASIPSMSLVLMIALVVMRMVPYLSEYGVDAVRDSVVVVYGLFSFIVIALLLEEPGRLSWVLGLYSRFAWFYGIVGMALLNLNSVLGPMMPAWPFGGIPVVYLRLGEGATHLTGAAVFAMLGLRRVGPFWALITMISIGSTTVSRGAMLSCLLPIGLVMLIGRERKRLGYVIAIAAMVFALSYAVGLEVALPGGRSIGPEQIINGVESVIGTSTEANFDGTKTWRLNWWHSIVDYTVNGQYFWTGKGFGVNLAEDDGYMVGQELGGPPVRSPHNVNMTILARLGVPGLVLWVVTLLVWFIMLFHIMIVARRRGDLRWSDIFLWIACYGASIVIDSSFDVALEGPMLGIWFWCIFGLGIATTMIYRTVISGFSHASPSMGIAMQTPGRPDRRRSTAS